MKVYVIPGVPKRVCVDCGAKFRPGELGRSDNERCYNCGGKTKPDTKGA